MGSDLDGEYYKKCTIYDSIEVIESFFKVSPWAKKAKDDKVVGYIQTFTGQSVHEEIVKYVKEL